MDEKNKRQQLIVKICCVIASFGLWLYTSTVQNPVREYKLRDIPVELINKEAITNSKFIIVPNQEFKITLTLKGPQSEIYAVKPSQFKIVADMSSYLSTYVVTKGINKIPVEIKEKPENINIRNGEDLRVNVKIDELMQKNVPIKISVDGNPKEGYYKFPYTLKTSTAYVSGPAEYVKTVEAAQAKLDVKNATKDISFSLPLEAIDGNGKIVNMDNIRIQPNYVEGVMPIKKTKSVSINVKTTGSLGKDIILKSATPVPDTVEVVGKDEVLAAVSQLNTEPLDLSKLNGKKEVDVKLDIPKDLVVLNDQETIKVRIDTDKITQKNLSLNVQVKNLKDELDIDPSSQNVSIIITGAEKTLNAVKSEDVSAIIDLHNLDQGTYEVPVVIKTPENINMISSSPDKVRISLKKKTIGKTEKQSNENSTTTTNSQNNNNSTQR